MDDESAGNKGLPKDLLDALDAEIGERKEPPKALLDAIDEEIAVAGFSTPPGAKPIEAPPVTNRRVEPMREMITRNLRKPRTLVLLLLLLAVVVELALVTFTERAAESLPDVRTVSVRAATPASAGDENATEANADANATEANADANATEASEPSGPARKKPAKAEPAKAAE